MWRKIELGILRLLYRKGTVRRAKHWSTYAQRLTASAIISTVLINMNWKEDLYIENNTKVNQPQSFMIDGPDPWKMSEE